MKTERINGYLYPVRVGLSVESESVEQEEELNAEEYLAAKGVPAEEIKKIIIGAE